VDVGRVATIVWDVPDAAAGWHDDSALPGQPDNIRKVVLCSPAAWKDKVYLGFDGGLMFCFDAAKGDQLWAYQAGGPIRSSPSISTRDGLLYFGCHDGNLYCLDAATGAEKWKFPTGGKIESSPAVEQRVVFVGSDDGLLYAIE